jgi:hypothetical protein
MEGPETNRDGIGAKISLYYNGKMQQYFDRKRYGVTFLPMTQGCTLAWEKP